MSDLLSCPCCGYPTLSARGDFEICLICWWEDDGQDDHNADEVFGGPNGRYSLTMARENFVDHFDMYEAGQGIGVVADPSPERKAILAYLAAVKQGERRHDLRVLQGLLRTESDARRKTMQ